MNTRDLSEYGYRELDMAGDLLKAIKNGLPDDFGGDGIAVEFNPNSGEVFLTNDEADVCMAVNGQLESWYFTPYRGLEGFWEDLVSEYPDMHPEDQEYMRNIASGRKLPTLKGKK